jgi:multidrug efflux system membrane fusion protein
MADDSTLERLARMRQAVDGSQAPRIAAEKIEARSPRG